ncbi:MAG: hypothetical protein PHU93_02930 [Candidatus Gracilibacteria bacterium]|nr:hypothetical protein [Candidatus Gracilibacteria bacterium]
MFLKVGAVLVIISVSYVLAIFLAPAQADELASVVGVTEFNAQVRSLKQKLDSTDSLMKFKDQTGSLVDGSILDSAKSDIDAARAQAEKLRETIKEKQMLIENKVQQANQIVDTASSLKTQINTFTTLSGATGTGAGSGGNTSVTLSGSATTSGALTPNR